MKCSACGSRYPNSCPVCREDDPPRETPDHEEGHLLKTITMKADTQRTLSATAFVLCIVAIVLMGTAGCRSFEAYLSAVIVAAMAAFVGSTSDA